MGVVLQGEQAKPCVHLKAKRPRPVTPPPAPKLAWSSPGLPGIASPPRKQLQAAASASALSRLSLPQLARNNAPNSDSDTARSKAIRSLLLNFLDSDVAIKRRLDLGQHQLDSGHAVTDAAVQEVRLLLQSFNFPRLSNFRQLVHCGTDVVLRPEVRTLI
jgi:hypothetical protein